MHANHKVRRRKDDGTDLTVWSETDRDTFRTGQTPTALLALDSREYKIKDILIK